MLRTLARAAVLIVFLGACVPDGPQSATATPVASAALVSPTPAPTRHADDMTAALLRNPLPNADLFDLTRRLRGRDGTPATLFEPSRTTPPDERVGSIRDFWIYDFDGKTNRKVSATLKVMTEHAKWWVASDVTTDPALLQTTADQFEKIYPVDRRIYGSEWTPGIDGDPRVAIILARIPGRAAGYFSSADELPLWVNEFSAEKEMIYINSLTGRLATPGLYSVLAHELCHMIQFNRRVRSVVWFNEGHSQLCERANGFTQGFEQVFLRQPDTQLNDWPELDEQSALHYGVAFLFLEFLRQHAGGEDLINAFLSKGIDTPADLDTVLRARGQPGLEQLFGDFVAANALIGHGAEDRYAYIGSVKPTTAAGPTTQDRLAAGATLRGSVHQYAARYVELPRSAFHLAFDGARGTRVIPTDAHSGRAFWWSDRADGLDSTLTRDVDLRTARSATLTFWTWFELEKDFDYGYVAVSDDGGSHWKTLATPATTRTDPNGNNLGDGYTNLSGGATASWIQQKVDLSAYAGKQVRLRFEVVTDGALNLNGMAIDDLEIPEVGYRDDAEQDGDWQANGFIRSTNVVRQRYIVQVLRFTSGRPTVERVIVEDGALELDIDASGDRLAPVLAVTGLAPRTSEVASFSVTLSAKR
ncbi:MAG: immune inhibitor A [Chloroflexi bacterium]|nr:immune inhibitor A [Chloroflexota bacterium]